MKTIVIMALEGMMDSSLAISLDTLKTGCDFLARSGNKEKIRIIVAGHKKIVRTGAGLRLATDTTFKELRASTIRPDWLIVPGAGITTDREMTNRFAETDAQEAMRLLQTYGEQKIKIAASCSSVFFLAQAGLLWGRCATTTWWLAQFFRNRYPDINLDETRMLVRDEHYLTAGSAFSQLDLSLAIVAETMGSTVAHLCSRYMLIDERPSQARYMIPTHLRQIDPTVLAAEKWIDKHLSLPVSVTALSSELAVSPKTLARRIQLATGVSPVKFIQRRKLTHAVHLIETTTMSIDKIAEKVGYQDSTALRKLVKREFGTTPGRLR